MTPADTAPTVPARLDRLLACGYLTLLAATWRLWIPQDLFPQVPLVSWFIRAPRPMEWGLLLLLIIALGGMLFIKPIKPRRLATLIVGLSTIGLVCFDQHRLQPWVWQFLILTVVLIFAQDGPADELWRWVVIGIYGWSAWSKIDYGFCLQHGPFLLDGLFKAIRLTTLTQNWTATTWAIVAGAIPIFELLVAIGLAMTRTRRIALVGSFIMHVGLLLALGPLGHNHRPGVLLWNLFFLVQNWLLFRGNSMTAAAQVAGPSLQPKTMDGNRFATIFVIGVMTWPILEPYGFCDHWPAWAVYAAKPERVTFFVGEEELKKLPEEMKPYLGTVQGLDQWHSVRIDRWSLDTVLAPIYPQDRFQVGVSLGIVYRFDLKQVRLTIEQPADRLTGKRNIRSFTGRQTLENLANSFRLNARPRY